MALRDAGDLRRDRRGEQRRLAGGRDGGQHRIEVLRETHVEHLVGLVEHDELDGIEVQAASGQMVDGSSRALRRRGPHRAAGCATAGRSPARRRPAARGSGPTAHSGGSPQPPAWRARASARGPAREPVRRLDRPWRCAGSREARRPQSCPCRSALRRGRRGPPGAAGSPAAGPALAPRSRVRRVWRPAPDRCPGHRIRTLPRKWLLAAIRDWAVGHVPILCPNAHSGVTRRQTRPRTRPATRMTDSVFSVQWRTMPR